MLKMSGSANTNNVDGGGDIRQQKQVLRKQIRSRLRSAYPSSKNENENDVVSDNNLLTKSNQVFAQLYNLPQYQAASTIGFFISMPHGEIQTRDAIRHIITKDKKTLYVPRVGLDFELCDMDLICCTNNHHGGDVGSSSSSQEDGELFYDHWPRNKWGIPEPPITDANKIATPGDIDLLIVPGLAFDSNKHRMGQGKGYYDRFIAKMRQEKGQGGATAATVKKPLLVGVCLEEQFLVDETIPISEHDFIMDMVLTPSKKV
ncbi:hypothetical protein ACHAWC_006755 [Mediolabrus comicus]